MWKQGTVIIEETFWKEENPSGIILQDLANSSDIPFQGIARNIPLDFVFYV